MIEHRDRTPHDPAPRSNGLSRVEFTRRLLIAAGIALLVVSLGAVFVRAYDIFFLVFLAVLLAILLRSGADLVARGTGLSPRWSLAALVLFLVAATAGGVTALGTMVASQVNELTGSLPHSVDEARQYLRQYELGRQVLDHTPPVEQLFGASAASRVTAFFSTTFGVLGNLVVLAVLTIYLAGSPRQYLHGLVRLVPPRRRHRAGEVLGALGFHLRWWLVGRLAAMVAVGLITGVGLWLVGVPQSLLLGLIATLLTAVPFVGPIAAAVPGILLALVQGPTTALWATGVYVLGQLVENYLITPLVQERTVHLPPVLTILAVVLVGALFGVLGLIVATPLAVAILVLVKTLYVEDVLGDRLDVPGAQPVGVT